MQAKQIIEAFQVLDSLEATSSRTAKEQLLEDNKDNKALQQLLYWAYSSDKYYTYPSIMWRPENGTEAPAKLDKKFLETNWVAFTDLLSKLVKREITGNAAQDAVDALLNNSYWWEIKWFGRALSHDLKAGFGARTINKIWDPKFFWSTGVVVTATGTTPSENVAFAGTMLCAKYSAWNGFGTRFVEPKLDGYRLCLIMYKGEYSFYTRSGRCDPYNANLKHIVDRLHAAGIDNVMLDAEVMHEDWNKTGVIKHKHLTAEVLKEIKEHVKLYVFDCVDWNSDTGHQVKLEQRKKNLIKLLGVKIPDDRSLEQWSKIILKGDTTAPWCWDTKIDGVKVLSWIDARSEKELNDAYAVFLEQGHEGAVIKDPIGHYNYTGRRTASWLKHKPLETVDAQIVGFELGTVGTKNEDRLGAMHVKTADGLQFKIGIGFKDHERDSFWTNQKVMMGQWVEAKFQKDNVADGRFGRFIRMRDDLNA